MFPADPLRMIVYGLTPILNVSNFEESVAWFEKLGWKSGVHMGRATDIRLRAVRQDPDLSLCEWPGRARQRNQHCHVRIRQRRAGRSWNVGHDLGRRRRRGSPNMHRTGDRGDVAATDMSWGVREMHARHPEGTSFGSVEGSRNEFAGVFDPVVRRPIRQSFAFAVAVEHGASLHARAMAG